MNGTANAMALALLVAGVAAAPLPGVAHSESGQAPTAVEAPAAAGNHSDAPPPGARLAGVVGAQEAEVRADVESRAFDVALERAGSDEAKARIVARQAERLEERVTDLEERRDELERARRDGNISDAAYAAQVTALTARTESVRWRANESRAVARGLPEDVAASRGANATALGALERRAANLTGPEAAATARAIVGPGAGRPASTGPPTDAGQRGNASGGSPDEPGDRGQSNRTERGESETAGGSSSGPPDEPEDRGQSNRTERGESETAGGASGNASTAAGVNVRE